MLLRTKPDETKLQDMWLELPVSYQGRVENSLVTMESTLLYIGALLVEWLLIQEVSSRALLLAGRCDAAMPPLLVAAAEAKCDVRVVSSSPSSTMRSSPSSQTSDVCRQHRPSLYFHTSLYYIN